MNARGQSEEWPSSTPFAISAHYRQVLGFGLSCNEMEVYGEALNEQGVEASRELSRFADQEVTVAGVIVTGRRHMGKDGNWMLFLTLQDRFGLIEVVLFSSVYDQNKKVLADGGHGPYLVRVKVQVSGKGRGIGIQLPADLTPASVQVMKLHPVVIADELRALRDNTTLSPN